MQWRSKWFSTLGRDARKCFGVEELVIVAKNEPIERVVLDEARGVPPYRLEYDAVNHQRALSLSLSLSKMMVTSALRRQCIPAFIVQHGAPFHFVKHA